MIRVALDPSSLRGRKTGIGNYTESLWAALRAHADAVQIVELLDGATVEQRTDRRIVREQWTLPRLARAARADLMHLTGFAAPRRAPCPVVLTVHDLIGMLFPQNFPPASRLYWSRYLPLTLRFPRMLVADSEQTRRDMLQRIPVSPERVRVVYPGRDEQMQPIRDPRALEETRAALRLPPEFLLFVSTLEPRKGIDTLIAAFAQIAGAVKADLVMVGNKGWGWEGSLAKVERLGLGTRVHRLDYVPAAQLAALYNLARAFVFPSRYEGFGLPPLEAMSCGTPVICSNAAALPEVVGEAGLLFAPEDVEELAGAMQRVLSDEGLRGDLAARGLVQAAKFSWERAAQQMVEVYEEVMQRGPR